MLRLCSSKGHKKYLCPNYYNMVLTVGSAVGSNEGREYFPLGSSVGFVEGDGPGRMMIPLNCGQYIPLGILAQGPGRG